MKRYRNIKTGIEITTFGQVRGKDWRELKSPADPDTGKEKTGARGRRQKE